MINGRDENENDFEDDLSFISRKWRKNGPKAIHQIPLVAKQKQMRYRMREGTNVLLEDDETLKHLESQIQMKLPIVHKIEWNSFDINGSFGIKVSFGRVEWLGLYNKGLTTLPMNFCNLKALQTLNLCNNEFTAFPEIITKMPWLKELNLEENDISTLPESLGHLISLQTLYLGGNSLTSLSETFGNLTALQTLDLSFNQLSSLPASIGQLPSLKDLYLQYNQLSSLSVNFECILETLKQNGCNIYR